MVLPHMQPGLSADSSAKGSSAHKALTDGEGGFGVGLNSLRAVGPHHSLLLFLSSGPSALKEPLAGSCTGFCDVVLACQELANQLSESEYWVVLEHFNASIFPSLKGLCCAWLCKEH